MIENHVRIVRRRADRRLMGSPGVSETLCGGPMSDRDITPKEARADIAKGSWEWLSCEKCRSLIESGVAQQAQERSRR